MAKERAAQLTWQRVKDDIDITEPASTVVYDSPVITKAASRSDKEVGNDENM